MNPEPTVTIFSPAKSNLFLAITGRRADGYHDLVSVVAPLDFGDELTAQVSDREAPAGGQFSLECDDPDVPCDGTNLILKAATAFAGATGWERPVAFRLTKRIPLAAGLGGGSSNAAAALLALNRLSGTGLGRDALAGLAAGVGSDCPLFLAGEPVVMRGRGEQIASLPAGAARRLRGRRVLLFKPALGISTAWVYARLAALAGLKAAGAPLAASYLRAADAEGRLAAWIGGDGAAEQLLFNSLEPVVFRKFVALPTLLGRLRARFGLTPLLSGSGSACFALLPDDAPAAAITECIRDAWGTVAFVQVTAIT